MSNPIDFAEAANSAPSNDKCILTPVTSEAELRAVGEEAGAGNHCWVGVQRDDAAVIVGGWMNTGDRSPVPASSSLWGNPTHATVKNGKLRDAEADDLFHCAVYKCCKFSSEE